jgi:hypothetical protein
MSVDTNTHKHELIMCRKIINKFSTMFRVYVSDLFKRKFRRPDAGDVWEYGNRMQKYAAGYSVFGGAAGCFRYSSAIVNVNCVM